MGTQIVNPPAGAVAPAPVADEWLDLDGYTNAVFAATTEIVSAAANTGGIDVLLCTLNAGITADEAKLEVGGTIVALSWYGPIVIERLRIPAGQQLRFSETGSAACTISYKVL